MEVYNGGRRRLVESLASGNCSGHGMRGVGERVGRWERGLPECVGKTGLTVRW